MTRTKNIITPRKRRKNILKLTKGFVGSHSRLFRIANQQMMRSLRYSYFDRKKKKPEIKSIWISRIGAICHSFITSLLIKYSRIISFFKKCLTFLNRKVLSEIIGKESKVPKLFIS